MNTQVSQAALYDYIKNNEVVYQTYGDLVEISNDSELENRTRLMALFAHVSSIELYSKGDQFISEDFCDLDVTQRDGVRIIARTLDLSVDFEGIRQQLESIAAML